MDLKFLLVLFYLKYLRSLEHNTQFVEFVEFPLKIQDYLPPILPQFFTVKKVSRRGLLEKKTFFT